jgi:AcrR family transcriptional regulator
MTVFPSRRDNASILRYLVERKLLALYAGVVSTAAEFRRARSPEHKQSRSEALVAAARELALEDGEVRTVTLTRIAERAGMHVSGVRRYFDSREQIYLILAAEEWTAWSADVRARLGQASPRTADALAGLVADTLAGRALFCDLLGHASLELEREVSVEAAYAFKSAVLAAIESVVAALIASELRMGDEAASDLVSAATIFAGALWQATRPPEALKVVYREHPELGHLASDFAPKLRRMIRATLVGLVDASGQAEP